MSRLSICCRLAYTMAAILLGTASANAQVVTFRLETTDVDGNPVESIQAGNQFLLNAYTQQVGGVEDVNFAGVFAGYMDISYDESLASIVGPVEHSEIYSNGKQADLSMPGLMNNIGGFSSSADGLLALPVPPGIDEQFLFSVPMSATAPGLLEFASADSGESPQFDVLVWNLDQPLSARDIDFGDADLRIQFGGASLNIEPVPEPTGAALGLIGVFGSLVYLRRRKSSQGAEMASLRF